MDAVPIRRTAVVAVFALSIVCSCASPRGASKTSQSQSNESTGGGPDTAAEETSGKRVDAPEGFEVVAHRGARALKPENTLPSFEAALDTRPEHIELDLHLSKDDRLVVWHDAFIRESKCRRPDAGGADRRPELPAPTTLEEREEAAKVRNLTAAQLRAYQCDRNPQPEAFPRQDAEPTDLAGDDYGIVTLDEVFEFVQAYASSEVKSKAQRSHARRVGFFLEIKRHPDHPSFIDDGFDGSGPAIMERKLVSTVRDRDIVARSTVLAHRPSLWAVGELEPEIRLAVAEAERHEPLATYADRGASYWMPNAEMVDEADVGSAHETGLRVVPWTVNDPTDIERLIDLGVDGVMTDDPSLVERDD